MCGESWRACVMSLDSPPPSHRQYHRCTEYRLSSGGGHGRIVASLNWKNGVFLVTCRALGTQTDPDRQIYTRTTAGIESHNGGGEYSYSCIHRQAGAEDDAISSQNGERESGGGEWWMIERPPNTRRAKSPMMYYGADPAGLRTGVELINRYRSHPTAATPPLHKHTAQVWSAASPQLEFRRRQKKILREISFLLRCCSNVWRPLIGSRNFYLLYGPSRGGGDYWLCHCTSLFRSVSYSEEGSYLYSEGSHLRSEEGSCLRSEEGSCLRSEEGSCLRSEKGSCLRSEEGSCLRSEEGSCLRSEEGSCLRSEEGSCLRSEEGSCLYSEEGCFDERHCGDTVGDDETANARLTGLSFRWRWSWCVLWGCGFGVVLCCLGMGFCVGYDDDDRLGRLVWGCE